jgi:hypothetical protein
MSRMDLEANEALRRQGWRVFRSASRDHLTPMSGPGAKLARIKIGEALPVGGVFEGVAMSLEDREAIDKQRRLDLALAEAEGASKSLGVTQYIAFALSSLNGNPDPVNFADEEIVLMPAPFDGFITELRFNWNPGAGIGCYAFRSSGGQTMFRSVDRSVPVVGQPSIEPDFMCLPTQDLNTTEREFVNVHMPVFAGEQIIVALRLAPATPAGTRYGGGFLGFESFVLARAGSAAAVSAFGALTVESRTAARAAASDASRLALEREKTSRATQVAQLELQIAQAKSRGTPAVGGMIFNPFGSMFDEASALQQLQSRLPATPPAPRVSAPPVQPPDGTGKTFVSAWNPSFGSIGYLIPDPPRGGKVNVFDNTYTIWDISGRNVGQGAIIPVASDAQIPPGAKISAVRSGVAPTGLTPSTGPGSTQL